jgi:hypothetical protein
MTNKKCQLKHGEKIHGLVAMDRFKTTWLKMIESFFDTYPKWGFFYQNF